MTELLRASAGRQEAPDLLINQLQTLAQLQRRADCLRDELATLHHQITDAVRHSAARPSTPAVLFGHETILVADDQIIVRAITQDILERFGYQVLMIDAGLGVWPAQGIDVVLLDVPAGGATSCVRVREAKARCGRVIVVTPLPEGRARDELREAGADAFLSKPLQPLALARCVREVITLDRLRLGARDGPRER